MTSPWRNTESKSPCKDCGDRYVGCHGECARYKPKEYDFGNGADERDYVHYLVETKRRFGKK